MKDYFADSNTNKDYFDESAQVHKKPSPDATRAGVDTSSIDGFRQGVEITHSKFYGTGIVKIHAGNPGHVMFRSTYGDSRFLEPSRRAAWFSDLDKFDSKHFVEAQEHVSYLESDMFSFPLIVDNRERWVDSTYDGVIEPLDIRSAAGLYSIDVPFIAHSIKGELMKGTVGATQGAADIDQVLDVGMTTHPIAYLDLVDKYHEYFTWWPKPSVSPFNDSNKTPTVEEYNARGSADAGILLALTPMSGTRDSYQLKNRRSTTSGWDYDTGMVHGTDSIAYGGMTY